VQRPPSYSSVHPSASTLDTPSKLLLLLHSLSHTPTPVAMYITPRSLRAVAYSTLAFSVAHASYVIDNLSFGCVHVWLPRPSIH
jgi:hypothetical protein